MNEIINFIVEKKDLLTIIITTFVGLITLATFIKAIFEYRLQGRQKRAQLFDKFKTTLLTEQRIISINNLLESNDTNLVKIPIMDRYYFLGYYEQIAVGAHSKLIDKDVAHYMFGYFAIRCWESENFWNGIERKSYYWSVFKNFAKTMQDLEDRNLNKNIVTKFWDKATGRSNFKY